MTLLLQLDFLDCIKRLTVPAHTKEVLVLQMFPACFVQKSVRIEWQMSTHQPPCLKPSVAIVGYLITSAGFDGFVSALV